MAKNNNPLWIVLVVVVVVLGMCSKDKSPPHTVTSSTPVSTTVPPHPPADTNQSAKALGEMYVAVTRLNQRTAPNGIKKNPIIGGSRVLIYEAAGDWVRISPDGQPPLWVLRKYLCSDSNCYKEKLAKARAPRESSSSNSVRRFSGGYAESCPCSSGRVCIGPRGGRFCITSGGNKRYGI